MGTDSPCRNALEQITACLIHPEDDFRQLKKATDDYFHLLVSATGIDTGASASRHPVILQSGKSIGPYWAAMCIRDMLRTKRFVRGLHLAIEKALRTFPPPVHILYAGTGPFASLALPMTILYSQNQIQFTLLESHPDAFSLLQKTMDLFRMRSYIANAWQVDATTFTPDNPVHILLTETMQRALDHEPQVEITRHLLPYLHPDGFLLPEIIEVYAGLLRPSDEVKRMQDTDHGPETYIHFLQTILAFNASTARSVVGEFPEVELTLHPEKDNGYSQLNLFTRVTVFENETLGPWSAGITLPKPILRLDPHQQGMMRLIMRYKTGAQPGFQIRQAE